MMKKFDDMSLLEKIEYTKEIPELLAESGDIFMPYSRAMTRSGTGAWSAP